MQLTIRMPEEYGEKINKIARALGLKKSDIARLAIKEYVAKNEAIVQKKPYDKVSHLMGIVGSGIPDLGLNHRQHIIDKIKKSKS